jgi:hypothetical protein
MLVRTCTALGAKDKPFLLLHRHRALHADVTAPSAQTCNTVACRESSARTKQPSSTSIHRNARFAGPSKTDWRPDCAEVIH